MPWKKIPLNQPVYTNVDDVSLSTRTPERHNTYRNDAGATVRRPGYDDHIDTATGAPVDGLYDWDSQNLAIIVAGGDVFKLSEGGTLTTLGTGLFSTGTRVTFADFTDTLYAANGGNIIKITTSTASALGDADIPANVTHVAAFDTYLLANKGGSGEMHRSDVLTPETWSGNFVTAEQDPDNLTAVHARWSEIWLFGNRTVERWYDDGETPFVLMQGGTLSTGCPAPYTIQYIRGAYYWLNERRELVRSAGQQYEIVSGPVNNQLQEALQVSDAFADYITFGGNHWYVLTIPSYGQTGRTLVYDIAKDEWQGKWNYWNSTTSVYEQFRGYNYVFIPAWNKHLLGDRLNGIVYYLKDDSHTDNGDTMRSSWVTGHIDHKTSRMKRSLKLRIRLKRGYGAEDSDPKLMLRWRNDGARTWGNIHYIDLNEIGEYNQYVEINRLGKYRSRQYELSVTDDVPVIIADAEELVEAMKT